MPRKKIDVELDPERQRQIEAGRRMAAEEFEAEQDIHRDVRADLYDVSKQAAETLRSEMKAGGKGAVVAALGVLDRTGHPPVRKMQIEENKGSADPDLLVGQVISGFQSLGEGILEKILAGIVSANPGILERLQPRPAIAERAEADVIDVEEQPPDEEPEDEGASEQVSNAGILSALQHRITAEHIHERSPNVETDPED